jgi:glutamate racemase
MSQAPTILVFDSGLGGLTVHAEVRAACPGARFVFVADDAGFPYGPMPPGLLLARVLAVFEQAAGRFRPDLAVVACNTASTLVLGPLRARHAFPIVGTVPAIKPAAALSRSGMVSVLATPGTVARDYTHDLIIAHAPHSRVTLVGSPRLAALAEEALASGAVEDAAVLAELMPCFREKDGARTDTVVLACTHFPLLLPHFQRLAPWPVTFVDPAPAIARRVRELLPPGAGAGRQQDGRLLFTGGRVVSPALAAALAERGLTVDDVGLPMPLAMAAVA